MKPGELPPGRVACRHCGYPIRAEAELCRFCRRLQTETGESDRPPDAAPGAWAALLFGGVAATAYVVMVLLVFLTTSDFARGLLLLAAGLSLVCAVLAVLMGLGARKAARTDPRYVEPGVGLAGMLLGGGTLVIFLIGLISNLF